MRFIVKVVFLFTLLTPLLLAACLWLAFSEQPLVVNSVRLSHENITRARELFKANDPRQLPAGVEKKVDLSEVDINLAANYLLRKTALGGAQIDIQPNTLRALVTLTIPRVALRPHLNMELSLLDDNNSLSIESLKLGQLRIPAPVAQYLFDYGLPILHQSKEFELAQSVVKQIDLRQGHIEMTYVGNPNLIAQARSTLLIHTEAQALLPYHYKLIELQNQGLGNSGSLTAILPPLFALALERSENNHPVTENTALLSLLGIWAGGQSLDQLVDTTAEPGRFRVTLYNRKDFAQHYLVSAALAVRGDSTLADAVGIFKEVTDSQGGSGFSFTDIAADRAGSRMGTLAISSENSARYIQTFFAKGVIEMDLIPVIHDLPEHMSDQQFQQQYGHVGSSAYDRLMDEIEQRIDACRIFQAAPSPSGN